MKKIILLLSVVACIFPGLSLAIPNISGVSGSVLHGQSITVLGTGFGIKNPAPPVYWSDFNYKYGTESTPVVPNLFSNFLSDSGFFMAYHEPDCVNSPFGDSRFMIRNFLSPRFPGTPNSRINNILGSGWADLPVDCKHTQAAVDGGPNKVNWYQRYYKYVDPEFHACFEGNNVRYNQPFNSTRYNIFLAENINDIQTQFNLSGDYNRVSAERSGDTLLIDGEKMSVTARAGTLITVTRGYAGTVPASHTAGTRAYQRLKISYNIKSEWIDVTRDVSDSQGNFYEPVSTFGNAGDYGYEFLWGEGGSMRTCFPCGGMSGGPPNPPAGGVSFISDAKSPLGKWVNIEHIVKDSILPGSWQAYYNGEKVSDCTCAYPEPVRGYGATHNNDPNGNPSRINSFTTPNIAINDTQTSFSVTDATNLSAGDVIRIRTSASADIADEVMRVDSVVGNTLTVTRGYFGSPRRTYAAEPGGQLIREQVPQLRTWTIGPYSPRLLVAEGEGVNGSGKDGPYHSCDTAWTFYSSYYLDSSLARVMLCNHQTLRGDGSDICEPQIPQIWSDDSVSVKVNGGKINDGQQAYLFVFNANNELNLLGYPVVFGVVTSDTTPPSPPFGLAVQ